MKIVYLLIFITSSANGYELWAHRLQEYAHPQFTHNSTCTEMPSSEVKETFDLSFLQTDRFEGVEVDAYYRADLGKLLVFHGSKGFNNGSRSFQCFNKKYVILEDLLDFLFKKFPKHKVWIDLKNQEFKEISDAAKIIKKIGRTKQIIVESKSVWGVIYLKSQSIASSLWIQTKSKNIQNRYKAFKQNFNNHIKMLIALLINPTRISQSCEMMTTLEDIFDNNHNKMCWNTADLKVSKQNISNIKGLQVVLEAPLEKL